MTQIKFTPQPPKPKYPTADQLPVGARAVCMGYISGRERPHYLGRVFVRVCDVGARFVHDDKWLDAEDILYRTLTTEEAAKFDGPPLDLKEEDEFPAIELKDGELAVIVNQEWKITSPSSFGVGRLVIKSGNYLIEAGKGERYYATDCTVRRPRPGEITIEE